MSTLIASVAVSMFIVLIFKFLNMKHNPPIFGIYQQKNKGYWIKFIFMYTVLKIKQLINHVMRLLAVEFGHDLNTTENEYILQHDLNLEQKYDLGDYSQAVDGVYFNGMSKGGAAVICGLARRPKHCCDAFLYLKVDNEDLLLSPNLPDTHLEQNTSEQGEYSVQGITINNFMPMRAWTLSYNGEMKSRLNPEKRVKVEVALTWSANWTPYEYDTQMPPSSIANDMAREPWSSDYFRLLKKLHQTHYEQMGFIKGTAVIDGKVHLLNMPCLRDRSFGPLRDWRNFHRYVYHFIFLENGDCMAVGTVSEPTVLSQYIRDGKPLFRIGGHGDFLAYDIHGSKWGDELTLLRHHNTEIKALHYIDFSLNIGYVCRKADQAVLSVDSSDFQLYQHGENQILPKDYGFVFKSGGQSYAVKIMVNDEDVFYIGKEREAKFYERWCSVEVNGVKGWACVEWHYNNVQNRNKK